MKPLVVFPPLLLVREDFVGLLYLLEMLLGLGVLGIRIGVVLADQHPVGLPDIVAGSAPG
jgi:hypothetical protein